MKFKKLLAVCMTAAMFLSVGGVASAATASEGDASPAEQQTVLSENTAEPKTHAANGTCGDSMTWSYNESTGVLTIKGSGEMTSHPWDDYKDTIGTVSFSGNITSICKDAFSGCNNIESITIPASVVVIDTGAFEGCENLDTVTFAANSNLTTLGPDYYDTGVFQDCINLGEIVLPDKLTSVGYCSFSGCENLEKITIGKNVKYIRPYSFAGCRNLKKVSIPDSVESIGYNAFYACSKLTSVALGKNLQSIGSSSFYECTSLEKIVIPASVTDIYSEAFKEDTSLTSVTFEANSNLATLGTDDYGEGVFQNCTGLKSIALPDKLERIECCTFMGCESLESATIGKSVSFIGRYAFSNCQSLSKVIIPDSVESIDHGAFNECSKLASVAFGNKLTSIGGYSFYGCTSLKKIAIPASVTYIGNGAFKADNSLISVTFAANSNLTTMGTESYYGEGVFQNCTGLKSVILPDKLTSMGYCLFSGCTNLESVVLGKHITSISRYAFENCTSLKKIVLPKSLTYIDYNAFLNCSSLNTVKYTGSEARWNDLKNNGNISSGNSYLLEAPKFVYDYSGIPLSITSHPESVKVESGSKATFTVKATGSGLKYQWYYKNSTQTSWSKWGTTSTPTKSAVTTDKWDKMQVRCKVTDSSGDYEYSDIATVTIIIPLKILQEPKNIEVLPGQKGTFTVKASGTGLKYQWYYKSKSATKWSAWNGQAKASVTFTATSKMDGMQVRCKVTDYTGKAVYTNTAKVTVVQLKITQHPANVKVNAGSSATFTVKASGTGLKYQWYYKSKSATKWSAWSDQTKATVTAKTTSKWNGMQVRCKVTDATGKAVYSNAATVTIIVPLKITQHPANVKVSAGSSATFTVKANGTGLKYQWYYKSKSATKWSAWNGQTKASVTAKTTSKWNGMQVRCKVTDATGKAVYSNAATVTIAAASTLKITQQPKNVTASADDVVPFVIKASGSGLKYQWYIKKSGQTSWKAWSGRTSAAFFSTANSSWNGMQVRCIVTDSTGKTVTSNTVKVTIK